MTPVATPQNSGKIETQEAAMNLDPTITSAGEDVLPSKYLRFLSFQMVQIVARKDDRRKIFPLVDPNPSLFASKRS